MSEETVGVAGPSAGVMLRSAREATGLHIAALSVAMKVSVKKLEALEADKYESIGDPVFVRALASSMCRSLKIDPAPILERLPHYVQPTLQPDKGSLNTTFKESGSSNGMAVPGFVKGAAFPFVSLLLVAALAVFLYPKAPDIAPASTASAKAGSEGAESPVVYVPAPMIAASAPTGAASAAPSTPAEPVAPSAAEVAPSASANGAAVLSSASALVAVPASTISNPAPSKPAALVATLQKAPVSAPQASAASAPVVALGGGILVLRPKASSWVQVTDSKGVVQLRKILQAGEVASVGGDLPLSVVVGRADATVVEVRGKVMALETITQDNVARFEVK